MKCLIESYLFLKFIPLLHGDKTQNLSNLIQWLTSFANGTEKINQLIDLFLASTKLNSTRETDSSQLSKIGAFSLAETNVFKVLELNSFELNYSVQLWATLNELSQQEV